MLGRAKKIFLQSPIFFPESLNNETPIELKGADQSFMLQKSTQGNCASFRLQLKPLKFTSGATYLSSLAPSVYLQHLKVSPCVPSDQKLAEINREMPRRSLLRNLRSLLPAGLKMTEHLAHAFRGKQNVNRR